MIDKLAKIGVIHKNKAANLKSGIALYINKLSWRKQPFKGFLIAGKKLTLPGAASFSLKQKN